MSERVLSQEEIDKVFRTAREPLEDSRKKAQPYDFRRPDRIAKDQLRAIHVLHETFARSMASSLSAYLRAYVMVNLVSVEQLSFREFTQCLPSPTCLVSLQMRPFEGNAVLEMNPALVFPILEMLLGGSGKTPSRVNREVTEIEQSILDSVLRITLQNLKSAWSTVTNIDFSVIAHETDPGLLQILAPNEALVAIAMEIRVGNNFGLMNIGIPSIFVKMLRQKFDQQWSVRKTEVTDGDHARVLNLIKPSMFQLDARLDGASLTLEDLLGMEKGDVLKFDCQADRPIDLKVNGRLKYHGAVVTNGRNRAFVIDKPHHPLQ